MTTPAGLLRRFRTEIDKRPKVSPLEYGTVLSASPLVIQVDSAEGLTLEYDSGDFTMPDYLLLSAGDHVVISPIGRGHQYAVLFRTRGKLAEAVIGGPGAKRVAREGDPVSFSFVINGQSVGDHGSHSHTYSVTVTPVVGAGTSKVKVD